MARPTKLTEQMIKDGWDYLNELDVSIDTLLPTVEGLAIKLGISRETVYQWEKEDDQFSDIVKKLRVDQGQKLIQNALANRYNSTIAKLILSGKHGYVEQSATDITSNGNELGVTIDAAQAEQLIRARAERPNL
jgi:hypothetical protein